MLYLTLLDKLGYLIVFIELLNICLFRYLFKNQLFDQLLFVVLFFLFHFQSLVLFLKTLYSSTIVFIEKVNTSQFHLLEGLSLRPVFVLLNYILEGRNSFLNLKWTQHWFFSHQNTWRGSFLRFLLLLWQILLLIVENCLAFLLLIFNDSVI